LTGHHADDALETLLQRWLRGTDLHGLAGLQTRLRLRRAPARPLSGPTAGAPRRLPGSETSRSSSRDPEQREGSRPVHELLNATDRDVELVRPLIAMRREEVRQSLREKNLAWREDDSNASPRFTRNRVRNLLLPEIERVCGASAIE